MASLKELGSRLRKLDKAIKEKVNGAVQEFANAGIASTSTSTAVLTARAISNWRIQVGAQPPSKDIDPHVYGKREGSFRIASNLAYASIKMRKYGEDLHVYNNVDYIEQLDNYHKIYNNMSGKLVDAGNKALENYWTKTPLKW